MDTNVSCKIIKFQDGSTTMVSGDNPSSVTLSIDDNPVVGELMISVAEDEVEGLRNNIASSEFKFDTIMENTSTMKKNQTPPTEEIKVI